MILIAWATRSIWSILISGIVTSIVYVTLSHTWLPGENNRLGWHKDHVTDIMTDKPIPGLYAAGESTGGVHGAVRLGSVSSITCLVFGRIAGKNAAAEKPWA